MSIAPVAESSTLPSDTQVISKAVLRVCTQLEINQAKLAQILGLSPATVSRMNSGSAPELSPKTQELGLLLIRVYRSLDALIGNPEQKLAWFNSYNEGLRAIPSTLVTTTEGLVKVVNYLDYFRGEI